MVIPITYKILLKNIMLTTELGNTELLKYKIKKCNLLVYPELMPHGYS